MSIEQPAAVYEPPSGSGRPLDTRRDAAILDCALQLVGEVGYDRLTIEAIAQRCHASKATIYRRWDSKASLIVDAVKAMKPECLALPVTGDVRSDLLAYVSALASSTQDAEMRLVAGLLAASRGDSELASVIQDKLLAGKRELTREWTRQQMACGAIRAGVSEDLIFEIAPAMIFARLLVTAEPIDSQFLLHLVDDILLPLLAPPDVSPPPDDPQARSSHPAPGKALVEWNAR